MTHLSLLLGAGFSANMGYPLGNQLNSHITDLKPEELLLHSSGTLQIVKGQGRDPNPVYYNYETELYVRLVQFYIENVNSYFNYEEFFDYYHEVLLGTKNDPVFDHFLADFRKVFSHVPNNLNILGAINRIQNQVVENFLVDSNGIKYYSSLRRPSTQMYGGFFNCLEEWRKNNIVHVHTLNHDLLMEGFFHSNSYEGGELSTGFSELTSPYYGNFSNGHRVRLSYFSNAYSGNLRLYKLHGSLDNVSFRSQDGNIETYLKLKHGLDITELLKEIETDGNFSYHNDWTQYHSDFLTGTTSKIKRYGEPVYYEKIFEHFVSNLEASNTLIIIGYGCGDLEVNRMIQQHFNGDIFLVVPNISGNTAEFVQTFNATHVPKNPSVINLGDFV